MHVVHELVADAFLETLHGPHAAGAGVAVIFIVAARVGFAL